jgi:hypothetical protein
VRFSFKTLIRGLYAWRAGGKTAAALALNYGSGALSDDLVVEFANACLLPDVRSSQSAYAKLTSPRATASALRHRLSPKTRTAIKSLFKARRAARRQEATARARINLVSKYLAEAATIDALLPEKCRDSLAGLVEARRTVHRHEQAVRKIIESTFK